MTPKEKYLWMKLYAVEFGWISFLMFIWGLSEKKEVVITGGVTVAVFMALLTLVLLFRITYLKGQGHR